MSDLPVVGRAARLDRALTDLLGQAPELEAAAVVSFDGLAMASTLPAGMDEDRVAAMSAALLSLGEKAAQGLGRGDLSQVYVEGETGTVFLISCDDEAVLVAVAAAGAKAGLMLFEVRRAAATIADVLRAVPASVEADHAPDSDAVAAAAAELAEAEAAYAAHKAAQAETQRSIAAAEDAARESAERAQREAALAFVPVSAPAPVLAPALAPVPTGAPSASPLLIPTGALPVAPVTAPAPEAPAVPAVAATGEQSIEDASAPSSWVPSYAVQGQTWS
jgi:predicted regulator of Ras-like GTPase activity (Roadblock/LC7/MglB family)